MTLPNELHPGFFTAAGGGGDVGDTIQQSLRFKNVNYLANGSLTIQGTSTMSMWVKVTSKSRVNRAQLFGSQGTIPSQTSGIGGNSSDVIYFKRVFDRVSLNNPTVRSGTQVVDNN